MCCCLSPYTDAAIEKLGKNGVKSLIVVPVSGADITLKQCLLTEPGCCLQISFVSDHIETLEEIDIEYRELAQHNGIEHWKRVCALNTEPDFILCLRNIVVSA
jgi:ferrochelatase